MINDVPMPDITTENSVVQPAPEISIISDGNRVYKPGMKLVFVEDFENVSVAGATQTIDNETICTCNMLSVCTCNMVCTCEHVCTCENVCSCVSYVSCSCESHSVCSCNSHSSNTGGGGTWVPCTGPCSCVPVH